MYPLFVPFSLGFGFWTLPYATPLRHYSCLSWTPITVSSYTLYGIACNSCTSLYSICPGFVRSMLSMHTPTPQHLYLGSKVLYNIRSRTLYA